MQLATYTLKSSSRKEACMRNTGKKKKTAQGFMLFRFLEQQNIDPG